MTHEGWRSSASCLETSRSSLECQGRLGEGGVFCARTSETNSTPAINKTHLGHRRRIGVCSPFHPALLAEEHTFPATARSFASKFARRVRDCEGGLVRRVLISHCWPP